MSVTLETVTKKRPEPTAEQVAAEELVRRAREQGICARTSCAANMRSRGQMSGWRNRFRRRSEATRGSGRCLDSYLPITSHGPSAGTNNLRSAALRESPAHCRAESAI